MQIQNNNLINTSIHLNINKEDSWKHAISSTVFSKPIMVPESAWAEHVPFAFWIISALKPGIFVELGTHYGLSYFAFCQAILQEKIGTKCFAIDTWKGDEHAGFYDNSVFEFVNKSNKPFSFFSTLLRSTFDDGLSSFENKSIDLLHIDGLHTYEAVKNDFNNWLPKISEQGIIIFHDTSVTERGFGVYKLWEELRNQYPYFEFTHGHGLGIIGIGKKIPLKIKDLFALSSMPEEKKIIQDIYERIGNLTGTEQEYYKINNRDNLKIEIAQEIKIPAVEKYLHPLQTLSTQVYWKKPDEEFDEINSEIQVVELAKSNSGFLFKINQDLSSLKKLRIDPATQQGLFYLHSISITNPEGKIIFSWEEIKRACNFSNIIFFKSTILENALVFISITNDPIIEIDLLHHEGFLKTDSFNLLISLSKLDEESANKEFFNINTDELRKEENSNSIKLYKTIGENLESTKKEISGIILSNTNEILLQVKKESLITYKKLEEEKSNVEKELKEQRLLFSRSINEANIKLQKKEEIINDLSKRIESAKEIEMALQQNIFQKNTEVKSLENNLEKMQNTIVESSVKNKEEVLALKKQVDELLKKIDQKKIFIEENQKQILSKELTIQDMQNKISEYKEKYENNSIFGIFKEKIKNKNTK